MNLFFLPKSYIIKKVESFFLINGFCFTSRKPFLNAFSENKFASSESDLVFRCFLMYDIESINLFSTLLFPEISK